MVIIPILQYFQPRLFLPPELIIIPTAVGAGRPHWGCSSRAAGPRAEPLVLLPRHIESKHGRAHRTIHRNAPFGWKQPLWLCWELCLSEPWLLTFVSPPGAAAAPCAARPLSGPSLRRCPKPPQGPLCTPGMPEIPQFTLSRPPAVPGAKVMTFKVFIPPACSHRLHRCDPTAMLSVPRSQVVIIKDI